MAGAPSIFGSALAALTDGAMFIAIAHSVTTSAVAAWKFALIAVAGMNIVILHVGTYRTVEAWELGSRTPLQA